MAIGTNIMQKDQFESFFEQAVMDPAFRQQLRDDGFGTLAAYGYVHDVVPGVQQALSATESQAVAGSRCGVCGVCGLCSFCGEVNAGSASAFLWATFSLD